MIKHFLMFRKRKTPTLLLMLASRATASLGAECGKRSAAFHCVMKVVAPAFATLTLHVLGSMQMHLLDNQVLLLLGQTIF
mgnify:CR=1 FL=1